VKARPLINVESRGIFRERADKEVGRDFKKDFSEVLLIGISSEFGSY